ncbi:MAG: ribonuclease III [Oscillospiraceae bacterium]|nr:ribonuclease III [Oscillospiraceae bacterium]
MEKLEERLGYRFQNPQLLANALTHSSYANEHREEGMPSNERLEFLGDSVLGMVVADHLYREHPHMPEGELTRIRASLVCENSLYETARLLNLGSYLRLGRGENAGGGRKRPSILADATEAVLAAVYLDGGLEAARQLIERFIIGYEQEKQQEKRDYKTALQELVQRKSGQSLTYELTGESGPSHAKVFSVTVRLNGQELGSGQGRSKKAAEQAAAKTAVAALGGRKEGAAQ